MRTTIQLPDELLAQAKRAAAASGRTFTKLVEDALRETLAGRSPSRAQKKPFKVKPVDGNGLRPGVDLDSYSNLLDLMEHT